MHPEVRGNLAPLTPVPQERTAEPRLIVGAAIVVDGRVLACERAEPPEMAGGWEFPGGKAEPGESDVDALTRECEEELGVHIEVGEQVGPDVPMTKEWVPETSHLSLLRRSTNAAQYRLPPDARCGSNIPPGLIIPPDFHE